MANTSHKTLDTVADGTHLSYSFSYATKALMLSDRYLSSADIGKSAYVTADSSMWVLVDLVPTWQPFISSGPSLAKKYININEEIAVPASVGDDQVIADTYIRLIANKRVLVRLSLEASFVADPSIGEEVDFAIWADPGFLNPSFNGTSIFGISITTRSTDYICYSNSGIYTPTTSGTHRITFQVGNFSAATGTVRRAHLMIYGSYYYE